MQFSMLSIKEVFKMKYEAPLCEVLKLDEEDIIRTSAPDTNVDAGDFGPSIDLDLWDGPW